MIDVDRFRAGDHAYFTEIVQAHGPGVRKVCRVYAPSEDEVDDLVQGTFFLAYSKRRTYRGDGPFPGWLNRLAKNHCISQLRSLKSQRKRLEDLETKGLAGDLHRGVKAPDVELEQKEAKKALFDAVDRLPEKERQAVILRLIEDRPPGEVAAAMNITKASVRSNISRAVGRLRGIMTGGQP